MKSKRIYCKKNIVFITAIVIILTLFFVVGFVSAKYYYSKTNSLTLTVDAKMFPYLDGYTMYEIETADVNPWANVETVEFRDSEIPSSYTGSWAIDKDKNGSVTAYLSGTTLYIVGNGTGSIKVRNYSPIFYGLSKLTTITNFQLVDLSEAKYCVYMFYKCTALTSLDISSFNTANVTDMYCMFADCSNLASINFPSSFTTGKVTSFGYMFYKCSALTSLDLSTFNSANATDMYCMFYGCSKLASISFPSGFNTGNVTDFSYMFSNCSALTSLDLSSFNTASATDMCGMFMHCGSLSSIKFSSGFTADKVTDLSYMFNDCPSLTSLDISSFNPVSAESMYGMFYNSYNLKTIYASSFSTANVTDSGYMFGKCTSLVGGNGTTFSSSYIDKTYARIDGGPYSSTPGYFTYKAVPAIESVAPDDVYEEEISQETSDDDTLVPETDSTTPDDFTPEDSVEEPDYDYIPGTPEPPELQLHLHLQ